MNNFSEKLHLLFVNPQDKELYCYLHRILKFYPKHIDLYKLCFIHRSSTQSYKLGCNERLEYLGDAILDSITADYLYDKYPKLKEGNLSEIRASMVSRKNLNAIGLQLQLQKHILARIPQLRHNDAVGNCLEALIGAIYKDKGYSKAKQFIVETIIIPHIRTSKSQDDYKNYKSTILQYCQKNKFAIEFKTEATGEKSSSFLSEIHVNNQKVAEATGRSKKAAEQEAARIALSKKSQFATQAN